MAECTDLSNQGLLLFSQTITDYHRPYKVPLSGLLSSVSENDEVKSIATLWIELARRSTEERNGISWTTREISCGMKETGAKKKKKKINKGLGFRVWRHQQTPSQNLHHLTARAWALCSFHRGYMIRIGLKRWVALFINQGWTGI